MRTIHKVFRPVVKEALDAGWYLKRGTKHTKLVTPTGRWITIPNAPNNHRSLLNLTSQVRRMQQQEERESVSS